jgi:hypothetical protein
LKEQIEIVVPVYVEKQSVPRSKSEPVFEFIKTGEEVVVENLLIAGRQARGYGDIGIE